MLEQILEVLWVARYDYLPGWKLKNHKHAYYQIIYIIEGEGSFFLEHECFTILKNTLYLIKPGEHHGLTTGTNAGVKTLDIKFTVIGQELTSSLNRCTSKLHINIPIIKQLFERIIEEGKNKNIYYKEFSSTYLCQLLLYIMRTQQDFYIQDVNAKAEYEIGEALEFTSAIAYIKANYAKPINLSEIAHLSGYNKNYFCEKFRKIFGCTPVRYLYHYRIQKAKDLILYSDYSLKEIASLTGFESIHHFSRLFKQLERVTPGDWRSRERDGISKGISISDDFVNINQTGPGK